MTTKPSIYYTFLSLKGLSNIWPNSGFIVPYTDEKTWLRTFPRSTASGWHPLSSAPAAILFLSGKDAGCKESPHTTWEQRLSMHVYQNLEVHFQLVRQTGASASGGGCTRIPKTGSGDRSQEGTVWGLGWEAIWERSSCQIGEIKIERAGGLCNYSRRGPEEWKSPSPSRCLDQEDRERAHRKRPEGLDVTEKWGGCGKSLCQSVSARQVTRTCLVLSKPPNSPGSSSAQWKSIRWSLGLYTDESRSLGLRESPQPGLSDQICFFPCDLGYFLNLCDFLFTI